MKEYRHIDCKTARLQDFMTARLEDQKTRRQAVSAAEVLRIRSASKHWQSDQHPAPTPQCSNPYTHCTEP